MLNLRQSRIDGPGYKSGEFDILPNGSLIITKVTFAHNSNFTVVKLDSASEEVDPNFVTVVVKGKSYSVQRKHMTINFSKWFVRKRSH